VNEVAHITGLTTAEVDTALRYYTVNHQVV
jgi:hypothetical protein